MDKMILCGGHSAPFERVLLENGGTIMHFPRHEDISPFLQKNAMSLYIQDGFLVSSIETTLDANSYLFTVGAGTIIPKFDGCFYCKGSPFEHFYPIVKDLTGIAIPSQRLLKLRQENENLRNAVERDAFSIISSMTLSAVLFHSGEGINRVCNVLYCLSDQMKNEALKVRLTQKELAGFTGLSPSQLKRSLAILRQKRIISTGVGYILIVDPNGMRKYLSDAFFNFPCMKHSI